MIKILLLRNVKRRSFAVTKAQQWDGIGGVLMNIYLKDLLRHARENENENNLKQSFATTPKTDLTVEMVSVNDNKILSITEVS